MIRKLIPLTMLLAGCPTPPESGAGGGGAGGAGAPPVAGGGGAGIVDEEARGGTFTVEEVADAPGQPVENGMSSEQAQALVKEGPHITLSGEILCTACKGKLVLKVTPFQNPEGGGNTKAPDEQLQFQPVQLNGAGPFNVAVPKYAGKLVIEVLDDQDGNGRPSPGEPFAVLHEHGKIGGRKSHTGLTVDFSQTPPPPPTGAPPEGPGGKAKGKKAGKRKGKAGKGKRKAESAAPPQ